MLQSSRCPFEKAAVSCHLNESEKSLPRAISDKITLPSLLRPGIDSCHLPSQSTCAFFLVCLFVRNPPYELLYRTNSITPLYRFTLISNVLISLNQSMTIPHVERPKNQPTRIRTLPPSSSLVSSTHLPSKTTFLPNPALTLSLPPQANSSPHRKLHLDHFSIPPQAIRSPLPPPPAQIYPWISAIEPLKRPSP